jgi:hypothetical protein
MRTYIIVLLIIFSIINGCKKDNELKKSVWVPDSEYKDLPAYSEWGYNTFGAYYDRQAFISNDLLVPAKVIVTDSITTFELYGQLGESYYHGYPYQMVMKFSIPNFKPQQYTDLISLNNTTLNLEDSLCQVIVIKDNTEFTVQILSGELTFKKVRNLLVDTKPVEVILSGYFEFRALINNEAITITDGRYDVGVGPDNFYIY